MPRFRIEHRLGIAAPPQVVWEVLADLPGWRAWNPLYVHAEGALRIGAPLRLTQRLAGFADEVIEPTILDWVPDNQILWRLSEKGGLVQRLRYIELEKLTDEACIFSNGEDWSGYLARFTPPARRRAIRASFEAMGEALRDQALKLWENRGGAPTSAA